uniref:non-specific serine/threonine protein kinase n=1 Tax=Oryza punctata TaxID=4537 RepID=A0A0E0KG77_ORYPU
MGSLGDAKNDDAGGLSRGSPKENRQRRWLTGTNAAARVLAILPDRKFNYLPLLVSQLLPSSLFGLPSMVLLPCIAIAVLLSSLLTAATSPPGTIERVVKQEVVARRGGVDGETNTDDTNFLQRLELIDDGNMRIRDKDGELAWRASDEPHHAQHCSMPSSPGLATVFPPFAKPIDAHNSDLPFGMFPSGNGRAVELPQAADAAAGALGTAGAIAPLSGAIGGTGAIAPLPGAVGGVDPAFSSFPGDLPDPSAAGGGGTAPGVGGVSAGAIDGHLTAIFVAVGVALGANDRARACTRWTGRARSCSRWRSAPPPPQPRGGASLLPRRG